VGGVGHAEGDDGPRIWPKHLGITPAVGFLDHPAHVAVKALGEEFAQPFAGFISKPGGSEAHGVEAERKRPVAD
jgi:hypothetical protein